MSFKANNDFCTVTFPGNLFVALPALCYVEESCGGANYDIGARTLQLAPVHSSIYSKGLNSKVKLLL